MQNRYILCSHCEGKSSDECLACDGTGSALSGDYELMDEAPIVRSEPAADVW